MKQKLKQNWVACLAALWLVLPVTLQAQVHIGGSGDAVKGALLDLTIPEGTNLGLLPLNISIDNINQMPDAFSDKASIVNGNLKGLVVYNINTDTGGPGLFVWDGSQWNKVECPFPTISVPSADLIYPVNKNATQNLSVTANGNGTALSYQWQSSITGTSGWEDITTNGTGATYAAPTTAAGTLYYQCIVSNSCGKVTSKKFTVTVNDCTAKPANPTLSITATTINRTGTYAISCSDVGNGVTTYTWVLPAGLTAASLTTTVPTITVTGATSGTYAASTIKVTASNACDYSAQVLGTGGAITVRLDAVTIDAVGGGTSFCGGVIFKLTKPASWSTTQWTSLSASNVTATLAGAAYSGSLTFDGTYYYYGVTATAASQSAVITVSGNVSGVPVISGTKTVTVNLNTDSSFAVGGENCFDIKRSSSSDPDWNNRVQADFTRTYEYALSGTVGSGFTISSVTWSYTNPENAVETFTPLATNTTPASNKVTVKYNPSNLIGNTNINATGIQVVITATIVATSTGACPTAVYTVSRTVTIKNADCCTSVTDLEGNFYYAHQFGDAGCWMTQNLRSTYTMQGSTQQTITRNANAENKNEAYYHYPSKNTSILASNPEYGLLYTWAAANIGTPATESTNAFSGIASTRQGICPQGWHLPSVYEWNLLEKEIATDPAAYSSQTNAYSGAGSYNYSQQGVRPAVTDPTAWGRQMKSTTKVKNIAPAGTSKPSSAGGFDGLLVGMMVGGSASNMGDYTNFLTACSYSSLLTPHLSLVATQDGVNLQEQRSKTYLVSVRCKKND
ncbi:MAG: fibrobacter succinogenes major paralogous domain-containing protein [Candidatus Symbiothrix sp.]|jgi:uncharacterized protein (TIGR02145 family)|nr:fibrobacter succinogenes major paralogous domain-containing protein [Candidatus Symbiothrix sp.]